MATKSPVDTITLSPQIYPFCLLFFHWKLSQIWCNWKCFVLGKKKKASSTSDKTRKQHKRKVVDKYIHQKGWTILDERSQICSYYKRNTVLWSQIYFLSACSFTNKMHKYIMHCWAVKNPTLLLSIYFVGHKMGGQVSQPILRLPKVFQTWRNRTHVSETLIFRNTAYSHICYNTLTFL